MRKTVILFILCIISVVASARNLKKSYYITPEDFGCVSGDINKANHNSRKLQEMINYAVKNGKVVIGDASKKYFIAKGIEINGPITLNFNRASLVATVAVDMVVIKGEHRVYAGVITGLQLDLNKTATTGINCVCAIKSRISDCSIIGIPQYGVGMLISKGYEVFVDNVHFEGGDNYATGLRVNTADCHFTDLVMIDCHTAVDNLGVNFYDRIHAWIGEKGKWLDGSVFFLIRGWGPIFIDQCFCDTYDVGFLVETATNLFITQLRNFQNMEMWNKDISKINPVFFKFKDEDVVKKSFISLDNSYVGGVFVNGQNRQLFSNLNNHRIRLNNTVIE